MMEETNDELVQITFTIPKEEEEIFLMVVEEMGYKGSIYTEIEWDFSHGIIYITRDKKDEALQKINQWFLEAVQNNDLRDYDRVYSEKLLEEEDWRNHWKKYFSIIPIGEKLEIVPAWLSATRERIPLFLEPKMGFGTGQHESTYLCLLALEKEDLLSKRVLDIGAGSGILGVASVLLGAFSALLLEQDILSLEACKDTSERNHVSDQVKLLHEDVFSLPLEFQGPYELALINIIAEVIVEILPLTWVSQIPVLYLSGILKEKKELVLKALHKNNWRIIEERTMKEWVFLKVTKTS